MDQDFALKAQLNIRQNQRELQDFLGTMGSWEQDVKKKDNDLKTKGNDDISTKKTRPPPPIRNAGPSTKGNQSAKKVAKKSKPKQNGKAERISSYNYRAWDTLDVDKMLDDIDTAKVEEEIDDGLNETEDMDATDEETLLEQNMQLAAMEKDKGNAFLKEGKYEEAVLCYTKGVTADPTNILLLANRAMAYLKLKKYSEAEEDSSKAIALDPTYIKSFMRRGSARFALDQFESAKQDFEKALELEPSNRQARAELVKIHDALRPKTPPNIVKPIHKPKHLRSKKPLRRIQIDELPQKDEMEAVPITELTPLTSNTPTNTAGDECNPLTSATGTGSRSGGSGITILEPTSTQSTTPHTPDRAPGSSKKPSPRSHTVALPPVPSNSTQFVAHLKKLKNHRTVAYQYLKQIEPGSLARLFQQSIDSSHVTQILGLLQEHYVPNNDPVFPVLKNLTVVKRFGMATMFMTSEEKQGVQSLLQHVRTNETVAEPDLENVILKFGLET